MVLIRNRLLGTYWKQIKHTQNGHPVYDYFKVVGMNDDYVITNHSSETTQVTGVDEFIHRMKLKYIARVNILKGAIEVGE